LRSDDIWTLQTERLNIGTSGGYVAGITAGVGVANLTLKYAGGGTLEILGSSAQTAGTGYVLGSSEALTFGGPVEFFLSSTGATSIAHIIRGKTAGT